jgi:fatty-acyl-CoA synthase
MTLLDLFDNRADASPSRPLFVFHDARGALLRALPAPHATSAELDHGALANLSRRLAVGLQTLALTPIKQGDRVALTIDAPAGDFAPAALTIAAILACYRLGATPAVLNTEVPRASLDRRLTTLRAHHRIDTALALDLLATTAHHDPTSLRDALAAATPSTPSTPAFLQLTSGTSGEPKAAVITHQNLLASLTASERAVGIGPSNPDDILVGWVPLHHDLGLVRFALTPLYAGTRTHLLPPTIASLEAWVRLIAEQSATVTGAPDFAYRLATRIVPARPLPSLRLATNGGEPVRLSTLTQFESRFGCPGAVRPGYGMAEATLGITAVRPGDPITVDERGAVSCGLPLPGLALRIAPLTYTPTAPDTEPPSVPTGELGQVAVAGPNVFVGYLASHDSALDRTTFVGRWHLTGDTGYLAPDGRLTVLGRSRVMLKRAGAMLAPRELEEVADRSGAPLGVRFTAAVGIAGPVSDDIALVAEVRPGLDEAALATIRQTLDTALRTAVGFSPQRLILAPPGTIPLTHNGKIRHAALRDLIESSPPPNPSTPSANLSETKG